jgi:hypothetical protein
VRLFRYADEPDLQAIRFATLLQQTFPELLAPLYVRDGRGRHVEPNVWLRHRL